MNRFLQAITQPGINIIAEIKYSSPSHGPFLCQRPAPEIAQIYKENGAAAISVLTDRERFRGDIKYLKEVADTEDCLPLLRKDFIKTPEQVREARENGASAFLLIVRDLRPDLMRQLIDLGVEEGLLPLVEVHNAFELETAIEQGVRVIGVNNRDLGTFNVDINTSFKIARLLEGEAGYTLVAESGIKERSEIVELKDAGYSAFLIGSVFMDAEDPGCRLRELRGAK